MNKRVLLTTGALAFVFWAVAPVAMGQSHPAAAASQPMMVEGIVVEVQGQRIKVRTADGRMQWYSLDIPVARNVVGRTVRGVVDQAGDAIRLSSAAFSSQ